MNESEKSIRTLFNEASEITDEARRAAFLDAACGQDRDRRQRIEALLRADAAASGFLADPKEAPPLLSSSPESADRIGRFRLMRKLGEGGCGVVYLAEQEKPLRRFVALKVIKLGMDTKAVIARFEQERQALALMDHPCIAKVLDAGTTGADGSEILHSGSEITAGKPYFVMEWVDGPRITDFCNQRALSTRDRLLLFIQVCRAVQHAHQKGIIHRDLKPSNILVAMQDGVPVPKVIDFGIAKATGDVRLTDQTLRTAIDQFVGTPAYMSPEQAGLASLDIDTRSDVYSLGVLLYELLTGRTPFDPQELIQAGFDEMRRIIRETDPVRPSTRVGLLLKSDQTTIAHQRGCEPPRLLHFLRGDLDWVVMKCLEKDRSRRYETANGLAADLQRHLSSEPVAARPPSGVYRFQKLIRRYKLVFAAGAFAALALVIATAISIWQVIRTNQARSDLRQNLYAADMGGAFAALASGSATRTKVLLERHRPTGQADLRGFEWRLLYGLTTPQELFSFNSKSKLAQVAVSPDGRIVATGSAGGGILLWDLESRRELAHFHHPGSIIYSLNFSPDGRWLASGTYGPTKLVHVYDVARLELARTLEGHQEQPFNARFSPDGRYLATSGGHPYAREDVQGELFLWETASWTRIGEFRGFGKTSVGWLDFSPDGAQMGSGHGDGSIRRWNTSSQALVQTLTGHEKLVITVRYSPNGRTLASSGVDGTLRLWDLTTGCSQVLTRVTGAQFYAIVFSSDGRRLYAGGAGNTIRTFDPVTTREFHMLDGHSDRVFGLSLLPNGDRLISAGYDGFAKVWDLIQIHPQELPWSSPTKSSVASFSGGGRWLAIASGGTNPIITLSDPIRKQPVKSISGKAIGFAHRSNDCVIVAATNRMEIWEDDGDSLRRLREVSCNGSVYGSPVFSPDRKWVAIGLDDSGTNYLSVWNTVSWTETVRLRDPAPGGRIAYYDFSPNSDQLAVSDDRGSTRFWRIGTWQAGRVIDHPEAVWPVVFSPDWHWLVIGYGDAVRVIDVETGHSHDLRGGGGMVKKISFSPDGRTLAVGTHQGIVFLWNVATWREITQLKELTTLIDSLAFAPDGRSLVAVCGSGASMLWVAPSFEETDTMSSGPPEIVSTLPPK